MVLQKLLDTYQPIFQPPTTIPLTRLHEHQIHLLPNSQLVHVKLYRYPYFQKHEIELWVEDMLCCHLIRPSRSPYSSPVLLVKKKDGTWRFCMDYRALHAVTVKDRFLLPTIDELLDDLHNAQWFSRLDLAQGFHQIRMLPTDIPKTTFHAHNGHYEYNVMPFDLCNAPPTFQVTMNDLFWPFVRKFVLAFFDDILVYSRNFEEHLLHLESVLRALCREQFFVKLSKCAFGQQCIDYLGHIVLAKVIRLAILCRIAEAS